MANQSIKGRWLYLGSLITNTGLSFIWPLTTIYMHDYLHESLTMAGIVLLINSVATMVGNYVGGRLFDRWRPHQTLLIGISINVLATAGLSLWHDWPAYPLGLIVLGFGNGIVMTSINAYATKVEGRPVSFVFNILYFMSNLGLVIGTMIVGFVLPLGITYVFLLALGLFSLFWAVAWRHFGIERTAKTAKAETAIRVQGPARTRIGLLLLTFFITWLAYEQWQSNISAFMLQLGMSVRDYSLLWTVNAVLIVLLQPVVTYFDEWLRLHLRLRLTSGFLLFGSSFVLLLTVHGYPTFIAAMAVLTFGEVLALPAVATYVDLQSPAGARGRYQGTVQMVASAGRAVGPVTGAMIVDSVGYQPLFVTMAVALSLAVLTFTTYSARH